MSGDHGAGDRGQDRPCKSRCRVLHCLPAHWDPRPVGAFPSKSIEQRTLEAAALDLTSNQWHQIRNVPQGAPVQMRDSAGHRIGPQVRSESRAGLLEPLHARPGGPGPVCMTMLDQISAPPQAEDPIDARNKWMGLTNPLRARHEGHTQAVGRSKSA